MNINTCRFLLHMYSVYKISQELHSFLLGMGGAWSECLIKLNTSSVSLHQLSDLGI